MPTVPAFDTQAGIEMAINSLDGLKELIADRHKARQAGQELQEWILLGRFRLGSDGCLWLYFGDHIPAEMIPNFPSVVDKARFWQIFDATQPGKWLESRMAIIPPTQATCPLCGEPWFIETLHDVIVRLEFEDVEIPYEFIGHSFRKYALSLEYSMDTRQRLVSPPNTILVDGKIKAVDQTYIIQLGDSVSQRVTTYFHLSCHKKWLERDPKTASNPRKK